MRGGWGVCGFVVLLAVGGCANVSVQKVSVADRLAGKDRDVKGFRYYLTRPYILVKERVPLGHQAVAVRLVTTDSGYALESIASIPGTKQPHYFELNGQENSALGKASPKAVPRRMKRTTSSSETLSVNAQPGLPGGGTGLPPGLQLPSGSTLFSGALSNVKSTTAFDVVHLPDFEEQYAIHNRNIAAHSKYNLSFADGCKLGIASGSYNATEVPVKFLNTVQNLIGALTAIEGKRLKELLPKGGAASVVDVRDATVFYVLHEKFIEPGMYRIQKSWERCVHEADSCTESNRCYGLLTAMGFTISECTSVLSSADYANYLGQDAGSSSGS